MDSEDKTPFDEVVEPTMLAPLPSQILQAVDSAVAEHEASGDMDFNILQVQPITRMEMGPGSKGRMVPYLHYGFAAVMTPQVDILGPEGKKLAIAVPLPPSGQIKMSDLKKLANRMWRENRREQAGS